MIYEQARKFVLCIKTNKYKSATFASHSNHKANCIIFLIPSFQVYSACRTPWPPSLQSPWTHPRIPHRQLFRHCSVNQIPIWFRAEKDRTSPCCNSARCARLTASLHGNGESETVPGSSLECSHPDRARSVDPLNAARIAKIPYTPNADWRDLPNVSVTLSDGSATKIL
jgi:hypothetical protein